MSDIDIYQLYGSREDTDAAVIRHLDRELTQQRSESSARGIRYEAVKQALNAIGLTTIEQSYGLGTKIALRDREQAFGHADELTAAHVEYLRQAIENGAFGRAVDDAEG